MLAERVSKPECRVSGAYLLIILGIGLGLWVGLWWCFIGGIHQVVVAFRENGSTWDITFGIVRFLAASPLGWGIFMLTSAGGSFIADGG